MSFTCPRCAMTSHSPDDEREGYCGACHDWTGRRVPSRDQLARIASAAQQSAARVSVLGAVFLKAPVTLLGRQAGVAAARRDFDEQVRRERRVRRLRERLGEEPGADAMHWSPAD